MAVEISISPLRIAGKVFWVASRIERCPCQMMLRELVSYALEAEPAVDAPKRARIEGVIVDNVAKPRICNSGRGLSQVEPLQVSHVSSPLFTTVSLDGNFRMRAKAASLAFNKHGLREGRYGRRGDRDGGRAEGRTCTRRRLRCGVWAPAGAAARDRRLELRAASVGQTMGPK